MKYLNDLNEIQRKAVTTIDGPVMTIAGPGSGKTRVLTYRIAYLLDQGIPPYKILALTFTNKAAKEMKERIVKVVGEKGNKVWAGTFHSVFARMLRRDAEKIGYPASFTIYDTEDSKNVLKGIIKQMNLHPEHYKVNGVLSRISSAKTNLITPKLYEKDEALLEEDKASKRPHLHKIYTAYTAKCKKSGAMDFDDLLYRFFELLQSHPGVLKKYHDQFSHIMVDEFQDTNHLQYKIIKKLVNGAGSKRNICVVGDDAQSIYAFRGATIQNILDFERDYKKYGVNVFKLEINYRSTDPIVNAANELISYNRNQIKKTIRSEKGEGENIQLIRAMTDEEEGRRVASLIVEQKNRNHLKNSDIAILYRTNAQSRIFEEYLRRFNIPYRVFGGLSFYQRKEVKDMIAYIRLAVNPKDDEALKRVINYPKRGIGNTTLDKIIKYATEADKTLWESLPEVALPAGTKRKIMDFVALVKAMKLKAETVDAYDAAVYIGKKSGLSALLQGDVSMEGLGRLENFNSLLDGIKSFEEDDDEAVEKEDNSLSSYLQNIALMTDMDTKDASDDKVTLMTTHSSKGLEFPSVFVVGMEEDLFPSFMAKNDFNGLDEERRLFYVAITRAERFLTLSYSRSRYRYGKMAYNIKPSRFLEEVGNDNLRGDIITDYQVEPTIGRHDERLPSGVKGVVKIKRNNNFSVDLANFVASPPEKIQAGMNILHNRFGHGKVLSVEGNGKNKVATIFFKDYDNTKKRILLSFAKIQIL